MEKIAGVEQELPLDLIFEILMKLPVRSLRRFRCVSKLWRSVIADPRFLEAQHACSRAIPELLLLFLGLKRVDGLIRHAYAYKLDTVGVDVHSPRNRDLTHTCHNYVSVQNSVIERRHICHQAGSFCCRLWCCDSVSVRVWNPTTGKCLDIKTVDTETETDRQFLSINHFGFDPVEKKHKVLNILTDRYTGLAIRSRVFILEDNCWRATANAYPPHLRVTETESVICIDGIIFSAAFTTWHDKKLLAFHVRSGTFEVISIPEDLQYYKGLIEFTGRATLAYLRPRGGITLWMLEDPWKKVWRRKICMIPNYDSRSLTLYGGTPTGQLLFAGGRGLRGTFFLLLYNVERNTAMRIEARGLYEDIIQQVLYVTTEKVYFHVESLKSLKRLESKSGMDTV